ncbi:MAG TPA: PAS domain S-box protein [Spirochaetota bacterium]|nr:PAS domain S-box protein [Spirochaetota bacterium]
MNNISEIEDFSNIPTLDGDIFRHIFENNPQAIAVIDIQGYIVGSNRKWLEIFGYSSREMNGFHILDMMPDDDQASMRMIRALLMKNPGWGQFEGFFLKKNGEKVWADITTKLIKDSLTQAVSSIIIYADINNGDPVENIHKSSDIKSNVLLEKSPIGIVVFRTRTLLFANMAFAKMLGYDKPEDIIGAKDFKHVAEDQRKLIIERNVRLEQGLAGPNDYEIICLRKDGSEINVSVNTVRIILGGEPATLGFLQDITERKCIEKDLKKSYEALEERVAKRTREIIRLNQQVINSQEQERQRIAKDIHDGVGQSLLAVKVNISMFKTNPDLYPDRLERGLMLLDQSVRELREISSDLFPSVLDEFGLASAIRLYSKYSLGSAGINVELDLCDDLKTKKETEINLYRIVQESFSNILKHSGADSVKITLENRNDSVRLCIEDNGVGFNPFQTMQSRNHCGLISMKQRAEGLGGIMLIDTDTNIGGTKLMVILI